MALVDLRNDGAAEDIVLRDYADVGHPRTVCTFHDAFGVIRQIIDPRHVVIEDNGAEDRIARFAVVDLPEVRYRWFALPETKGWGSELITVGPDLDRVIWKQVDPEGSASDTIYISTAGRTRALATLPDTNGGRCGSPTDSVPGHYATSGSYVFVLNQPILPNHSLVVFKGLDTQLSIVPAHREWPDGDAPYMALWSPVTPALYWSQSGDVWRWTPGGGKQKFIAGVSWFDPTISADGRYLAYSVPRADGKDIVYLVNLSGAAVPHRIGAGPRSQPRFVNATQLWWRVEASTGGCTGEAPPPRIYNVTDGSEDGSVIDQILATWPATSAQVW